MIEVNCSFSFKHHLAASGSIISYVYHGDFITGPLSQSPCILITDIALNVMGFFHNAFCKDWPVAIW